MEPKKKHTDYFWMSFSDLMTSLFFVMLVLYVLTYVKLKSSEEELRENVVNLEKKLEIYDLVEENLKPLKSNSEFFHYEEKYKHFVLNFEVKFLESAYEIAPGQLENYRETVQKIEQVGFELMHHFDQIVNDKVFNEKMSDISYLVIISGYASKLNKPDQNEDYELSYKRAYNLWDFWKNMGVDFEADKYKGLIDLQISGNGWGGLGRYERDQENKFKNESKNQRFIIQIVPKIGSNV